VNAAKTNQRTHRIPWLAWRLVLGALMGPPLAIIVVIGLAGSPEDGKPSMVSVPTNGYVLLAAAIVGAFLSYRWANDRARDSD
jgi:hypothetical protein